MIPRSLKRKASWVGAWGMFMDSQEAEGRVPEPHAPQPCVHPGCRNLAAQECEWTCCAAHCAAQRAQHNTHWGWFHHRGPQGW